MNRPVRRVAAAVLLLFTAVLLRVNWIQVADAAKYRDDPRNVRVLIRTYSQERGPISVLAGQQQQRVAFSQATSDALKYLRVYPGGPTYAPVTGFVSLVYGTPQGVERAENQVLSGQDPRLFVRQLSDYVTGRQPSGGSVLLTINPAAQEAAMKGLAAAGKPGAAVALDPKTGAVLALASSPSFDPAQLSSHDPAQIKAYYDQLMKDPNAPLLNRAISATYPPGSTFKVITSTAAIGQGGLKPDSQIPSPPQLPLPQTTVVLKNFGGESCGGNTSTLADALRISCNTAFASLGLQLGDAVRSSARAFGFDDTGLSLPTPVAASRYPAQTNQPQAAQSAIGQYDVRATPLQMALVAAGIANGGKIMKPYLVQQVQAPDLSTLSTARPEVWRTATTPDVAGQVAQMMEGVVTGGTGTAAQIPGVRVAGKTGTAEHAVGAPPHAWFIGFAPAEDPKVAVAVLVENGGSLGSDATGGAVAAPIAKQMLRAVLGK